MARSLPGLPSTSTGHWAGESCCCHYLVSLQSCQLWLDGPVQKVGWVLKKGLRKSQAASTLPSLPAWFTRASLGRTVMQWEALDKGPGIDRHQQQRQGHPPTSPVLLAQEAKPLSHFLLPFHHSEDKINATWQEGHNSREPRDVGWQQFFCTTPPPSLAWGIYAPYPPPPGMPLSPEVPCKHYTYACIHKTFLRMCKNISKLMLRTRSRKKPATKEFNFNWALKCYICLKGCKPS